MSLQRLTGIHSSARKSSFFTQIKRFERSLLAGGAAAGSKNLSSRLVRLLMKLG